MCSYENILNTVRSVYGGQIKGFDLEIFSSRLYNTLSSLDRVSVLYSEAVSCEFEAGIEYENSRAWNLFEALIPLLGDCKETAQKLYDCFMHELDSFAVFYKLVNGNRLYLTDEQFSKVKDKALKTFDKQFLEEAKI